MNTKKSINTNNIIAIINTIVINEKNVGISFLTVCVVIEAIPEPVNILNIEKDSANIIRVIIAFLSIFN